MNLKNAFSLVAILGLVQIAGCGNDDPAPAGGQGQASAPSTEFAQYEGFWVSSGGGHIDLTDIAYINAQGEAFNVLHAIKDNSEYQRKLNTQNQETIRRLNALADLPAIGHLEKNAEGKVVFVMHLDVYKTYCELIGEKDDYEEAVRTNRQTIYFNITDQDPNKIKIEIKKLDGTVVDGNTLHRERLPEVLNYL